MNKKQREKKRCKPCDWQKKQFTLTTTTDGKCPNCGGFTGFYSIGHKGKMNKKQNTDWEKDLFDEIMKTLSLKGDVVGVRYDATDTEVEVTEMFNKRLNEQRAYELLNFIRQTLAKEKLGLISRIEKVIEETRKPIISWTAENRGEIAKEMKKGEVFYEGIMGNEQAVSELNQKLDELKGEIEGKKE